MSLDGLALPRHVRDCDVSDPGMVTASLEHRFQLENADDMLHGGVAAVLLDATMGAAARTLEPAGTTVVTQDLKITYLKPVRKPTMPITAVAHVVNRGRTASYGTGKVRDCKDRLVAHAVGNFWTRTAGNGSVVE